MAEMNIEIAVRVRRAWLVRLIAMIAPVLPLLGSRRGADVVLWLARYVVVECDTGAGWRAIGTLADEMRAA